MGEPANIQFIKHDKIDKVKWDRCIGNAVNALIYAESVYLDFLSPNWDAFVLNDYEAVMPLTWKKKWRIVYLYQPPFVQQGGVFFSGKPKEELSGRFFAEMCSRYRFAEININFLNNPSSIKGVELTLRNNYLLPLGTGYEAISSAYITYIRQRISRLQKFSLQYRRSTDFPAAIKLYKDLYGKRMPSINGEEYMQFEKLCNFYEKEGRVITRQVFNSDGKELLAVVILLKDDRRLYNIVSCVMPKGKKLLANYFLYNELIREFAAEKLILDFEGSDLPGVAYFYNKFTGKNQPYSFLKFNRLSLPLKLIKK